LSIASKVILQTLNKTMEQSFQESQNLRSALMWIVLTGLLFFSIFSTLSQLLFKIPVGNNPMPNWALICLLLFSILLLLMTALTKLQVDVNHEGIKIDFRPLGRETIAWRDVKRVEIRPLSMISVGRRYSPKTGHIYNAGADHSLNIELKNGRKLMVSTRQKEALEVYLKRIKKL